MPVHIQLTEDIQSGPRAWFKWVRTFTRSKQTLCVLILAGFTTILAVLIVRCACISVAAIAQTPTGEEESDFGPRFLEDILSGYVVGGDVAKPNDWPSQVSLQILLGGKYYHMCGAVLINERWAMTAAHCVTWSEPETVAARLRAVLGEHDLDIDSGREQMVKISKVYVHPLWKGDKYEGYDIAELEFDSNVTLNQFVQPAALPPAGQILPHNYTCYITGWGRTVAGGSVSAKLKQAYLPVVDHETCSRDDWWGSKVKTNMICAGGNGVDAGCYGDSGGPLNCEVNGTWVLHGLVSWGHKTCNVLKRPSVFTRVSDYIRPTTGSRFKIMMN